ncbi:NAD-dependent succinate-semialdehyde dehydrogenase [Nocardioides sp. BYT-33-1]|uniref:NAD-dependent succinate-semialdehyde dehydrogenase n=1 Tax=Nocardioides sp. BYT-33-1 TaxID=3416952 RepID=UPI003F53BE7A
MTDQITAPTFAVEDPATLEVVGHVPDLGPTHATTAVDRAAAAFPGWASTAPRRRADILRRAYELMLRDQHELATLISRENGKSLQDATNEVVYAAEFFRWYSEEAVRAGGEYGESPGGGARTIVTSRPVGVAALVTPWNFPAAMATRKIGPALAAGCTVVIKPAALTPLTMLAIAEILGEAGLPEGVVEVVTTRSSGAVVSAWMADDRVRKISFTGSTQVGSHLLHQAADRIVNASMELGGNAPVIVTEDADVAAAVEGALVAKFRNGGQACTAANRIYVHSDVVRPFLHAFGAAVEKLTVGPALDGAAIGPLVSANERQRVNDAVELAVRKGARVAYTAELPAAPGHFYPPTVLVDVSHDSSIVTEEIFGPVAPILEWNDEEDLLDHLNNSDLGLAAYVFAGDLGRAIRIAERLEVGMVGINRGTVSDPSAPFGGVKQSGLGREGSRHGLREYQETQYLSVDWPT